jgi:hypothetical protein
MRDFRAESHEPPRHDCVRSAPAELICLLHCLYSLQCGKAPRARIGRQPAPHRHNRRRHAFTKEGNCVWQEVDDSATIAGSGAALQRSRPAVAGHRNPAPAASRADTPQRGGHERASNAGTLFPITAVAQEPSGFSRPRSTPAAFPGHVARPAKYRPVPPRLERNGGWLATTRTNHRCSL